MYQEIQDHLYPSMSPDVRTQVSAHFERFLGDPEAFAYRPVLIHGDFGAGNILWNPEAREITGVIDFDSAGLSDPAIDLAAVSCFGEPLRAALLGVYPALEAAERRAAFYRGTFALQEALHGFHTGDRTAFERGMTPFCGGGNPTTPIT
jgi:aminoglycoside 2''-phosphotransferase